MIMTLLGVLALTLVGYNAMPFLYQIMPGVIPEPLLLNLWLINPLVSLLAGFIFGRYAGIKTWVPVVIGVLFVPTMFYAYNDSAAIYIPIYVLIAFVGMGVGALFFSKAGYGKKETPVTTKTAKEGGKNARTSTHRKHNKK